MKFTSLTVYFIFIFIFTSLLMFSACTKTVKSDKLPAFRFGSSVYVSEGFYKGCRGHIVDLHRCVHDANWNAFCYTVDAVCTSVNGSYSTKKNLEYVDEEDLVEDASN